MISRLLARAALAALSLALVSGAASAAHDRDPRPAPVPGTGGAWVYDGERPPSCNARDTRQRAASGHLGHGHRWSKRNFKGHRTKPPCYIRRASEAGALAASAGERP